jgi:hypothetical protein
MLESRVTWIKNIDNTVLLSNFCIKFVDFELGDECLPGWLMDCGCCSRMQVIPLEEEEEVNFAILVWPDTGIEPQSSMKEVSSNAAYMERL